MAEQSKSEMYKSLLPAINSGGVELLDHAKLIAQLIGLERRTARGGRDSIDHAPHGHDDIINAVTGAILAAMEDAPRECEWCSDPIAPGTTHVHFVDSTMRRQEQAEEDEWEEQQRAEREAVAAAIAAEEREKEEARMAREKAERERREAQAAAFIASLDERLRDGARGHDRAAGLGRALASRQGDDGDDV